MTEKENLILHNIKEGINRRTYKWTYTENAHTDDKVYDLLINDKK